MKSCAILGALLLLAATIPYDLQSQAPVYYDDVLLIINDSSEASREIGAYFAEKRGIPERRIVRLQTTTAETINDATFETIRSTIETAMHDRNLVDSINYIVTTKGVPLRITRPAGNPDNAAITARRASFESELMLINGPLADSIGNASWFFHAYGAQNQNRHFRRVDHGFYLVTRLDAYDVETVTSMIDRGGPNRLVDKDSVLFLFDREPGARDAAFDNSQVAAGQILGSRGWRAEVNNDTIYVTDRENVIGYASWGSNDRYHRPFATNAIPRNTWSVGSLAETFVSTSGRSLMPGTSYGQSLIADWLAEGTVGAKGYVFEPFTIALALPHVLFDRYTDASQGRRYNMAESFAMASRTLSWMEVVLGDPKTSIITELPDRPSVSVADTLVFCTETTTRLTAVDSSTGIHAWLRGDSATVVAAGSRFDRTHPLFVAEGTEVIVDGSLLSAGPYTYVSTNISGSDFATTTLVARSRPTADFLLPADTVEPGTELTFVDNSTGEGDRFWDFGDDTDTTTDGNALHTYTEEGAYFVRLTVDNGGCSDRAVKRIVVRSTSSVEDRTQFTSFEFTHDLDGERSMVTIRGNKHREFRLRLYDRVGRLIASFDPMSDAGRSARVDLGRLAVGLYFVVVDDQESRRQAFPLIRP